jgi:hypothetical protein
MLRLNEEQRRALIDKVPDLANLAAGGLVFGQFLSDGPFSMSIAVLGILLWTFFIACALALARGERS